MAWIGDELVTWMKTKTTITDIVGAGSAARIFEVSPTIGIPQKLGRDYTTRFLTLQIFRGNDWQHLRGEAGLADNRVEIRAYGGSPSLCDGLLVIVRQLLIPSGGFQGTMGTTKVTGIHALSSPDLGAVAVQQGSQYVRYFLAQDFSISHLISIAA